jgi:hypothetical protein
MSSNNIKCNTTLKAKSSVVCIYIWSLEKEPVTVQVDASSSIR